MMRFSAILFLVAMAGLAGCAQIQPYQDATGDSTAKLRLKMEPPIVSNLFLRSVDVTNCRLGDGFLWLTGGVERLYSKKVGMLDSGPSAEGVLEYVVPAERPIAAITVMHIAKVGFEAIFMRREDVRAMQPGMCDALAFTPKAGKEYELTFRAGPGTCTTRILELYARDNVVLRKDITDQATIKVRTDSDGKLSCEQHL